MVAVGDTTWKEGRCFHSPFYLSSQITLLLDTSYTLGSVFKAVRY